MFMLKLLRYKIYCLVHVFSGRLAVYLIFSFKLCTGVTRNVIANYNYFNYDSKQTYGKVIKGEVHSFSMILFIFETS